MIETLMNWMETFADRMADGLVYFVEHPVLHWVAVFCLILYLLRAENPHEPKSRDFRSLRLSRIGLACLAVSWLFGVAGFVLAAMAFILGLIGVIMLRIDYGVWLMVGSFASFMFSLLFVDSRPF